MATEVAHILVVAMLEEQRFLYPPTVVAGYDVAACKTVGLTLGGIFRGTYTEQFEPNRRID